MLGFDENNRARLLVASWIADTSNSLMQSALRCLIQIFSAVLEPHSNQQESLVRRSMRSLVLLIGCAKSFASRCQGGTLNEYVTRSTPAQRRFAAELRYTSRRKREIPGRPWIDLDLMDTIPVRNACVWSCARECANRWAYDPDSFQPSGFDLRRGCVGANQSASSGKSRVGSQGRPQWRADQQHVCGSP